MVGDTIYEVTGTGELAAVDARDGMVATEGGVWEPLRIVQSQVDRGTHVRIRIPLRTVPTSPSDTEQRAATAVAGAV